MTNPEFIAFRGASKVASGDLADIVRGIFREGGDRRQGAVLVFDATTSQPVELDLRGDESEALARLVVDDRGPAREATDRRATPRDEAEREPARRGPGRPRLGVVARELTLLPRHWEWLNRQPGGASAAVRRLVDAARGAGDAETREGRRRAEESAYRFLSAMLGDAPGFEAATRALFAGDAAGFDASSAAWPADLRAHARRLAATAFSFR